MSDQAPDQSSNFLRLERKQNHIDVYKKFICQRKSHRKAHRNICIT